MHIPIHRVRVYRNTSARRFNLAHLPVDQTIIWLGPIVIIRQPRRRFDTRFAQPAQSVFRSLDHQYR